jgi:hypothetical protein
VAKTRGEGWLGARRHVDAHFHALGFVAATGGNVLAPAGWLIAALGWAAYGTHDAHLRSVLGKWERTIEKWRESSRR